MPELRDDTGTKPDKSIGLINPTFAQPGPTLIPSLAAKERYFRGAKGDDY